MRTSDVPINPLRAARNQRGYTQHELAELAGVDRNALVKIELGTRFVKIDYLRPLSRALGVPMPDLLGPGQVVTALSREDAAEFLGVDPNDVTCACGHDDDLVATIRELGFEPAEVVNRLRELTA